MGNEVVMIADWTDLTRHTKWIPAKDLGVDPAKVIDGIAPLDEHTFAVVVSHGPDFRVAANGPFVSGILRAPDMASARRALLLEIEGDLGGVLGALPTPLEVGRLTHRELLTSASTSGQPPRDYASYRATSDGAFVHRVVEHGSLSFYFRDPASPDDVAYAILYSLPR